MKLAICTLWTPELADLASITMPNNRRYAALHGHNFIEHQGSLEPLRPPAWSKVRLLQTVLPDYDWVFWIDADAAFTSDLLDIADFIDPQFDFIIGKLYNGINCGAYLIRNSPAGLAFLQETWDQVQFTFHGWWENAAMMHLLSLSHAIRAKELERPTFNKMPQDWQPGDLVIHPAGLPMTDRTRIIANAIKQPAAPEI